MLQSENSWWTCSRYCKSRFQSFVDRNQRSLEIVQTTYMTTEDAHSYSESCFTSNLIQPSLQIVTRMLRRQQHDVTYFPGEVELVAMTEQLKAQGLLDNRFKYNADGIIRMSNSSREPLLVEVSSAYSEAGKDKAAFDHYKAMFGLLAVLRSIACRYRHGGMEAFKRIKVHFLHAHGRVTTGFEVCY